MKICTIGFTKKSAETFFELLKENGVKTLIDVRRNNTSQLAAFAKGDDLRYFLAAIGGIGYAHDVLLAPTEELLKRYKQGEATWEEYEMEFLDTMRERGVEGVPPVLRSNARTLPPPPRCRYFCRGVSTQRDRSPRNEIEPIGIRGF